MDVSPQIRAERLDPGDAAGRAEWTRFIASAWGTSLFHQLDFLDYHPCDRFRFHHLVFRREGRIEAVLPGGLVESGAGVEFHSPLGASFGGFAVRRNLRAEAHLALVEALQDTAGEGAWRAVEITLPPARFQGNIGDAASFALFCRGFRITRTWLCHGIAIGSADTVAPAEGFQGRMATAVRAASRAGLRHLRIGHEGLDRFLPVFFDTYQRHGSAPTHSPDELRDLMTRLPDRIFVHMALDGEEPVAGIVVFRLTADVATVFYICTGARHAKSNGAAFAIAGAIGELADAGVRYLDLGPSASDANFNSGVSFFKEGFGATGLCRARWRWEAGEPGCP